MRVTENAADPCEDTDMGHWAKPELDPDQTLIFYPTLRESLAADHPIHLTDEILRKYDWSAWEAEYVLVEGQPPIHPRHLAGAIAYGMTVGIRSSRRLEEACRSRLDFRLIRLKDTLARGGRRRTAPPAQSAVRRTRPAAESPSVGAARPRETTSDRRSAVLSAVRRTALPPIWAAGGRGGREKRRASGVQGFSPHSSPLRLDRCRSGRKRRDVSAGVAGACS